MINELIVAIANKTTGFEFPQLNVLQAFKPVTDVDVNEVRSILTKGQDIWSLFIAKLIHADHYASLLVSHHIQSTDMTDIAYTVGTCTGCELIANGAGAPRVTTNTLPVPWEDDPTIRVQHRTESIVTIRSGRLTSTSPVTITGDRLHLTWPAGIGVRGDIRLQAPYSPNTDVSISVPIAYPFSQVTALLDTSRALQELVEGTGLADSYYFADSDTDKVVVAGLALYLYLKFKEVQDV